LRTQPGRAKALQSGVAVAIHSAHQSPGPGLARARFRARGSVTAFA